MNTLLHRAVGDALSHFLRRVGGSRFRSLGAHCQHFPGTSAYSSVRLVVAGENVKMRATLDRRCVWGLRRIAVDQDLAAALLDMRERDVLEESR